MYNEPKRDLFLLLIISALLHLVVIVIILLSRLDDSVKEYKNALLKAKEKKEKSAQVIFQQPPEKKQKPKTKLPSLFTAGPAASAPAAPMPPVPVQKPRQPVLPEPFTKPEEPEPPKEQETTKKEPQPQEPEKKIELEEKKEIQKKLQRPENKRTKITETKKEPEKKPETERPKKQLPPQPIIKKTPRSAQKNKLTLADIAKGFMNYARVNTPGPPSDSNHAVTVIGAQAGKATEEQLRYERYAAKLFKCIQTSLTILLRNFRFIHKPDVQNLALNFVMDIDAKGDIAGLIVRQSTGNQQFDAFMIKVLQHASKSFPPLPIYFRTDVCSFPMIYTIPVAAIQMASRSPR